MTAAQFPISATWWQVLLDVVIAGGTVGAVVAALLIAARDRQAAEARGIEDRRAADNRATADRRAIAERELKERQHNRRITYAMWRLDLLVRLAHAHERFNQFDKGVPPPLELAGNYLEAKATVQALIRAYPESLPMCRYRFLEEFREEDDRRRLDLALLDYGFKAGDIDMQEACRAEIVYFLERARHELLRVEQE